MRPQVFLCHASEDKHEVMKVYRRLRAEGFKPWVDKEDLLPGEDWDKTIRKVIRESDAALAFFSNNSVSKRGYYQRELKLLLDVLEEMPPGQIFVIPVRIDDCDIHDDFKEYYYANLFKTTGIDKVISSLESLVESAEPKRFPGTVHLDPVLQLVQGWADVAKAAEKEMDELGLGDWQIDIRTVRPEDAPEDPDMLPWPEYFDEELRMEFSVRPEPVVGEDVESWSGSILDFLHQYVYEDDLPNGDGPIE